MVHLNESTLELRQHVCSVVPDQILKSVAQEMSFPTPHTPPKLVLVARSAALRESFATNVEPRPFVEAGGRWAECDLFMLTTRATHACAELGSDSATQSQSSSRSRVYADYMSQSEREREEREREWCRT